MICAETTGGFVGLYKRAGERLRVQHLLLLELLATINRKANLIQSKKKGAFWFLLQINYWQTEGKQLPLPQAAQSNLLDFQI